MWSYRGFTKKKSISLLFELYQKCRTQHFEQNSSEGFLICYFCHPNYTNPLWPSQYNPASVNTSLGGSVETTPTLPPSFIRSPCLMRRKKQAHRPCFVMAASVSSERNRGSHRDSRSANCCVCKKPELLKYYEISFLAYGSLRIRGYSRQPTGKLFLSEWQKLLAVKRMRFRRLIYIRFRPCDQLLLASPR